MTVLNIVQSVNHTLRDEMRRNDKIVQRVSFFLHRIQRCDHLRCASGIKGDMGIFFP